MNNPINVPRPRTLGDIKAQRAAGQQKTAEAQQLETKQLENELRGVKTFHDPNTGKAVEAPTLAQMSQLLQQQQELVERGTIPKGVPLDLQNLKEQFPGIEQRVRVGNIGPNTPLEALGTETITPKLTQEDLLRKERPEITDEPEDPEIMDRILNRHKYPGEPIPVRRRMPKPWNEDANAPTKQQTPRRPAPNAPTASESNAPQQSRLQELRGRKSDRLASRLPSEDEYMPENKEQVYSGKPRFNVKRVPDSKFERVNMLSGCVFYDFKEVHIRKFNLMDQINITKARETRDTSLLIDTLAATLPEDINMRDFALPDMRFLLYWHRWNSYKSVPFNVNWDSKYGFRNTYTVTDTTINMRPPKITEEEYIDFLKKGFCIPTVREYEVFQTENLNADEIRLLNNAQYFLGEPDENGLVDIQQKIDAMNERASEDLGLLIVELPKFKAAIDFGIDEYVDLRCAHFDPHKWLESLKEKVELFRLDAQENLQDLNIYNSLMEVAQELENEANNLAVTLEQEGEVQADLERINLKIDPLDIFPVI